jgi:hypothetical protein
MQADHLSLYLAFSRTTSLGFLSSLIPRNTGYIKPIIPVHSVKLRVLSNLFCAISSGLLGTAPNIFSNALNREEYLMGLGIWN